MPNEFYYSRMNADEIMSLFFDEPYKNAEPKNAISDESIPPIVFDRENGIQAKISEIAMVDDFYLVIQNQRENYDLMQMKIKDFYQKYVQSNGPLMVIPVGLHVAARGPNDQWFRAKVLQVVKNSIRCQLLDFGREATFSNKQIYSLDTMFKTLPACSFRAKMMGVPNLPMQFCQKFFNLVDGKILTCFVMEEPVDDKYEVILVDGDKNINEEFIQL